jgi:hypothetical protein
MSRTFTAHSALGDALEFRRMSGHEEMGRLFEFHVDLLSESDGIDPKSLLGTDLTVEPASSCKPHQMPGISIRPSYPASSFANLFQPASVSTTKEEIIEEATIDADGMVVHSRILNKRSINIEYGDMDLIHGIVVHQTGGSAA